MKPANPSMPLASSLDRRSFLRLSSLATVTAVAAPAIAPTQGVEPPGPACRRAGAKPELYGRWFAV